MNPSPVGSILAASHSSGTALVRDVIVSNTETHFPVIQARQTGSPLQVLPETHGQALAFVSQAQTLHSRDNMYLMSIMYRKLETHCSVHDRDVITHQHECWYTSDSPPTLFLAYLREATSLEEFKIAYSKGSLFQVPFDLSLHVCIHTCDTRSWISA